MAIDNDDGNDTPEAPEVPAGDTSDHDLSSGDIDTAGGLDPDTEYDSHRETFEQQTLFEAFTFSPPDLDPRTVYLDYDNKPLDDGPHGGSGSTAAAEEPGLDDSGEEDPQGHTTPEAVESLTAPINSADAAVDAMAEKPEPQVQEQPSTSPDFLGTVAMGGAAVADVVLRIFGRRAGRS